MHAHQRRFKGSLQLLVCTWFGWLSASAWLIGPVPAESLQAPDRLRSQASGIQLAQAASPPVQAAAEDGQDKITLEPLVVTAPRAASPITEVPAAVSAIDQTDIQLGQPTVSLNESLVRIPGVFSQNPFNFAQDVRLSIRGFGARAAFGIRGIKVLVDGIPETLPDGQSQVDSVDVGSTRQIEVMRGPVSALYGNASGGVLSLTTEDGPARPFIEARTTHGSYGLWKMQLKSGGQVGPFNSLFNLSRLELDGYREQSRTESVVLNSKIRLDINASTDLTLLINVLDSPRADDPGGLTREEVAADRRQAAPLNKSFNAGEEVTQQRAGLVYRRELAPFHDLEVMGFFSARQFRNAIPFRVVEFDRTFLGGGIKYIYSGSLFGHRNRLIAGLDVQNQKDRRQNYDNVDGRPGRELLLNQDETVTSVGPYIQNEFAILDQVTLLLGGRFDYVRFDVDDFYITDTDDDDSGDRTFNQATGRFGLRYSPFAALNLYVNLAQAFETPSTTELVNRADGRGGLNPDLEPQQSVNYEIGAKGLVLHRLSYEVALFYITLRDELVPRESPPGNIFFVNAGKSRRYGAELGLGWQIVTGFRTNLTYTYLNAEFEDFVVEGVNLDGRKTPGLPAHQVYGELFYRHALGFYGGIDVLYVSDVYVDDANTETSDAYVVSNLRLGYEYQWQQWVFAPFFGMQNVFDNTYNANVRINAFGGRYFEPAPERNIYGGVRVAYNW